ncbi:MAG: C10 family peptidase [Bacteroidales bacterium]|nr:C10 family peptidase [Bacteroidales bacterium]
MKKLKLLLFSALALATNSIFAESRTFDEIQTIANKTLVNSGNVYLADVKTANGDTVCYTFKGNNGGYAIVSADTRVPGLLAYSKDGEINQELQEMLNVFVENIDKNRHQNIELPSSTSELRATRITDSPIAPLLKNIAWGQYAPFNLNAPTIKGTQSPVGCSATAIAQLLTYYRYPAATLSDIPAYTTKTEKIDIPGVEKGTKFDWNNILDTYEEGYTEAQAKAASDLVSVVDAAAEMDYGEEESACYKTCVEELVNVFGFDPDLIRISYRAGYTFEEWSHLIYKELKENRPVLMAGSSMTKGHRFLCDGIDENGLFHINWGWNGHYNGYYDLAILNPNTTTEVGSSETNDGYSKGNYIIYGIVPDNGVADVIDKSTVIEAVGVSYVLSENKFFQFYSYVNNSFEEKKIRLSSGYIDENGNVVNIGFSEDSVVVSPFFVYNQERVYNLNVSGFQEGKIYKVGLIESEDGKTWIPSVGFNNVNLMYTVKDGVVTVVEDYEISASVDMTDFNSTNQYAHGTIHLRNTGSREYYNAVYLFTNSVDTFPKYSSFGSYVTIESEDSSEVDFKFVPISDSVYYWLTDSKKNVLTKGIAYKSNKEFRLTASVVIDTTDAGAFVCRLKVKNEGDAYYDNLVIITLNHESGFYTVKPHLYLKPGEETTISNIIPNEFEYSRYTVYDCNGSLLVIDNMGGGLENSGEVSVNFNCNRYRSSDQIVEGNLIINNGTSEPHSATYILEIDTTGNFEGREIASYTVEIPAHSLKNIPLSLAVGSDTCNLIIYKKGDLRRQRYTVIAQKDFGTEIAETLASDNSSLKIWTMDGSIVAEAIDDAFLRISTIDGRILVSRRLHKGDIFRQDFPSAIYIVNGRKILVRK